MAIYSYNFANKKRDLADILSTVIANEPRFISLFPTKAEAADTKHEWLEDQIAGRSVAASAVQGSAITLSAADAAKVVVGTQFVVAGDSALFGVTAVNGTAVSFALIAANGSSKTAPVSGDVLNIVSTPIIEGSDHGENTFRNNGNDYNYTQIFRKEIVLTGTALAVKVYGSVENSLNVQTQYALQELTRDMNRVALFGHRTQVGAAANGAAGGLYEFGTQNGGLSVAAAGARLDSFIVNDAAQAILGAGATPSVLLVNPSQARVLSAEYKDNLKVEQSDDRRGAYVASVVNAITGGLMRIYADPDMPDTDAWLVDPAGFGLANLRGRAISDEDATPKGYDGIKRMAIGELTFEFKNAKQRLCRISGLQSSAEALAAIRSGASAGAGGGAGDNAGGGAGAEE